MRLVGPPPQELKYDTPAAHFRNGQALKGSNARPPYPSSGVPHEWARPKLLRPDLAGPFLEHLLELRKPAIGVAASCSARTRTHREAVLHADEIVINDDGRKGATELDSSCAAKPALHRRWHAALPDRPSTVYPTRWFDLIEQFYKPRPYRTAR